MYQFIEMKDEHTKIIRKKSEYISYNIDIHTYNSILKQIEPILKHLQKVLINSCYKMYLRLIM